VASSKWSRRSKILMALHVVFVIQEFIQILKVILVVSVHHGPLVESWLLDWRVKVPVSGLKALILQFSG